MASVSSEKHFSLKIDKQSDHGTIAKIARALSVDVRLEILKYMLNRSVSLSEISKNLNIPISSVSRHIDILEDAGLVVISYQPGLKGHTKFCAQAVLDVKVSLVANPANNKLKSFITEMPIGMYSDCKISVPCGMVGRENRLGDFDDAQVFYSPLRAQAECLWFKSGYVTYLFSSPQKDCETRQRISFSLEVCSDTIYYNNNWPSDITVNINGLEILTFTSPGNFGGKLGKLTPEYWPVTSSQFGQLKKISVDKEGVYLDNVFIHKQVTFDDLRLFDKNSISFTIGVKDDAEHCGGISIFGKNFGDFNQAIIMKIS